jgi:hypothetical protein
MSFESGTSSALAKALVTFKLGFRKDRSSIPM